MYFSAGDFNQDINTRDISAVLNMSNMFHNAFDFNQSLSGRDTSSVTNMTSTFENASSFDQDIYTWNTSSVINMEAMFRYARLFNKPLSGRDTSNVTNMAFMFKDADSFNGNIGTWDTSSVTDMSNMFENTNSLNQPLSGRDTSSVIYMSDMFHSAIVFNGGIGTWDTSSVTDMSYLFYNARLFNQPLSGRDTSNVTRIDYIFNAAMAFNQNINTWDTASVTRMEYAFYSARAFNQPLSGWNTSNVTNMALMFNSAVDFDQDIGNRDVSSVVQMNLMFGNTILSTANYDSLLTSWGSQILQTNVALGVGNNKYCLGESSRSGMITNYNWTITDGGKLCINHIPTDIKLDGGDSNNINENISSGAEISILTSIDADAGDSHIYTLILGTGDEDNTRFIISGDKLKLVFTPDFELPVDLGDTTGNNTYSIRIKTDDGNGGVYQKVFIITINDVLEACMFNGNVVNDGDTVAAYQGSSVVCGVSCVSEIRTCNAGVLNGTYTESSCNVGSCGGGGGSAIMKDNCPDGDNSPSYYDGDCGDKGQLSEIGQIKNNNIFCKGEKQYNEAELGYCFARGNHITTITRFENAQPDGIILRKHLAKIMINFEKKILGKNIKGDIKQSCKNYDDIDKISDELKGYIYLACNEGIMGISQTTLQAQKNFNPEGIVSRKEFGTVLSRTLWGNKYEGTENNRWQKHLEALKGKGYINYIDGNWPNYKEIRKYVWLVLERTSKIYK